MPGMLLCTLYIPKVFHQFGGVLQTSHTDISDIQAISVSTVAAPLFSSSSFSGRYMAVEANTTD